MRCCRPGPLTRMLRGAVRQPGPVTRGGVRRPGLARHPGPRRRCPRRRQRARPVPWPARLHHHLSERTAIICAWDRNHRSAVPTLVATGLRALARNHCNWAHKGCNWDRKHRGCAHADCTGAAAGCLPERAGKRPVPCPAGIGRRSAQRPPVLRQITQSEYQMPGSLSCNGFRDR